MDWGDTYGYTDPIGTVPGQVAAMAFNGSAGEQIELDLTNNVGVGANLSVVNSKGSTIWQGQLASSSTTVFSIPSLPASDSYTLLVDPLYAEASIQYTAGVVPGSSSLNFAPYIYGQRGRITFSASAGGSILFWASAGDGSIYFPVLYYYSAANPSERTYLLPNEDGNWAAQTTQIFRYLPETTTYYLEISGNSGKSTNVSFLTENAVGGNLTINGSAISLPLLPSPGSFLMLSFEGTEKSSIHIKFGSGCPSLEWQLIAPNGVITSTGMSSNANSLDLPSLSGTYYIAVSPPNYPFYQPPLSAYATYGISFYPGDLTNTYPSATCPISITSP